MQGRCGLSRLECAGVQQRLHDRLQLLALTHARMRKHTHLVEEVRVGVAAHALDGLVLRQWAGPQLFVGGHYMDALLHPAQTLPRKHCLTWMPCCILRKHCRAGKRLSAGLAGGDWAIAWAGALQCARACTQPENTMRKGCAEGDAQRRTPPTHTGQEQPCQCSTHLLP